MKIKITADSIIDLTPEYIADNDITIIPLFITLGDKNYIDGETVFPKDIYKYVSETKVLPKTATASVARFKEVFKSYVDDGYTVIHFDISSEMSASYQSATLAAKEVGNVYTIDSRNLSSAVGLLVMYACDLRKQGLDASEIVEKVKARIPYVQASFVIDKLDYLYKGGRCSSLMLLGANILGIRPSIEVHNGKMGVGKKYITSLKKAIEKYVNDILETYNNPDYTRIMVTHTEVPNEITQRVIEILKEKSKFREINETVAGCTITSHCGPGTLGILFINDGDKQ